MGGLPHNGKMYGFYDLRISPPARTPLRSTGTSSRSSASFEASGRRLSMLSRKASDPGNLFHNDFLRQLLEE